MIFVPLPFVSALLLIVLLVQMVRRGEGKWNDSSFFAALLVAQTVQSVLIGLRWGYDLRMVTPVQAVVATLIASLSWLAFRSLTVESARLDWRRCWYHALPAMAVLAMMLFWPAPVSLTIITIFLGYGLAMLWLARGGPDSMVASRLDGAMRSYRSLQVTALLLIGSAIADILISIDFERSGGSHAAALVAGMNVVGLLFLGALASVASSSVVADEASASRAQPMPPVIVTAPSASASEEDRQVAAAIDALMLSKQLYKDTELNLGRLARRLNLPVRHVSSAINRVHGMSVSQYVNTHRIEEACRLLATTHEPVTGVMMEAGFLSKSNFNREFLRVTGMSPAIWRKANRRAMAA